MTEPNISARSWTFAMVDLAGYTALTETHGDEQAADLAVTFAELTKSCLGPTDRLIKPIGDAVLLASPEPRTGLELVDRLLQATSELDGFPLARAGLHHGPAAERDGDMFGAAVNLAARVAGQASGGQTLVTVPVANAARQSGRTVASIGTVTLRNVAEPQELFEVTVGPTRAAGSVDPVCRMWVERGRASGFLRYAESDHWFCSLTCALQFASSPDSYTS